MNEEEAGSEGTSLALASCFCSAISEKQVLVCQREQCRFAKSQDNQRHIFGALCKACFRAAGY